MTKVAAHVSSRMVWPWVLACRELGLDLRLEFARLGLSEGQLRDPEVRLSHATLHELIQCLIDRSGREDLALLAACEVDRGYFDLLDLAVRTSATLGDAMERMVSFFGLLDDGVELFMRRGAVQSEMGLTVNPGHALHPAYVEFIPAMLLLAARRETGVPELRGDEIFFAHSARSDEAPYLELFGGRVIFDAAETTALFASRLLSLPMLRANAPQQRAAELALVTAPARKVGS